MIVRENDRAKFEESVDMRSDDAGEREKGGDLTERKRDCVPKCDENSRECVRVMGERES